MNPKTGLRISIQGPRCERKRLPSFGGAPKRKQMPRGGLRPSASSSSGLRLRRRVARGVLRHRVLLGQVTSGLAKPVGLDVVPDLRKRDRMIVTDLGQVDGMRDMLALRIDADLAFRRIDADIALGDHRAQV